MWCRSFSLSWPLAGGLPLPCTAGDHAGSPKCGPSHPHHLFASGIWSSGTILAQCPLSGGGSSPLPPLLRPNSSPWPHCAEGEVGDPRAWQTPAFTRSVPASSRVTVPGCKCVHVRGRAPHSALGSAGLLLLGGSGLGSRSSFGFGKGRRRERLPALWWLGLCQADSCGPSWPLARVVPGQRSGRGLLLNMPLEPGSPALQPRFGLCAPRPPSDGPDYCFDDSWARPGDQGPHHLLLLVLCPLIITPHPVSLASPCCSLCLKCPHPHHESTALTAPREAPSHLPCAPAPSAGSPREPVLMGNLLHQLHGAASQSPASALAGQDSGHAHFTGGKLRQGATGPRSQSAVFLGGLCPCLPPRSWRECPSLSALSPGSRPGPSHWLTKRRRSRPPPAQASWGSWPSTSP